MSGREYLDWRYDQHPWPYTYHRIVTTERGGQLSGIAILKYAAGRDVYLCEFLTDPSSEQAAVALLNGAIAAGRELGGTIFHTKSVRADLLTLWRGYGFQEVVKSYNQYLIVTKAEVPVPRHLEAMFTYGDFRLH